MTNNQNNSEIDLTKIVSIPHLLVKEIEFCFKSISTIDELEFINSLTDIEWEEIGWELMNFEEYTKIVHKYIFESRSNEFKCFPTQKRMIG